MACCEPRHRDNIPKCAIFAILNRLVCELYTCSRHKIRKYESFKCAVRALSSRSIDPRGGYAAFLGLRDNDPTKFAAIYIDNLRGEYDPNLGRHRIYHVAFVTYGDMNAICRTLRQRNFTIAGNADEQTGESAVNETVALKLYVAQPNPVLPIGRNMPLAGAEVVVAGGPEDVLGLGGGI